MNTSYFAKSAEHPLAVSIARRAPSYFSGREYLKLAPPEYLFRKYLLDEDSNFFQQYYTAEVLDKLDPMEVIQDIGNDAVLLCWEKPGLFCHRKLIVDWFKDTMGLIVSEL